MIMSPHFYKGIIHFNTVISEFVSLFVFVGTVNDITVSVCNEYKYGIAPGYIVNIRRDITVTAFFAYLISDFYSVFDYHAIIEFLQKNRLQKPQNSEYDNSKKHEVTDQFFTE